MCPLDAAGAGRHPSAPEGARTRSMVHICCVYQHGCSHALILAPLILEPPPQFQFLLNKAVKKAAHAKAAVATHDHKAMSASQAMKIIGMRQAVDARCISPPA